MSLCTVRFITTLLICVWLLLIIRSLYYCFLHIWLCTHWCISLSITHELNSDTEYLWSSLNLSIDYFHTRIRVHIRIQVMLVWYFIYKSYVHILYCMYKTLIWVHGMDGWTKVLQLFCWSMTPLFIISLYPMITHTPLVAGNLTIKILVARQHPTNKDVSHTMSCHTTIVWTLLHTHARTHTHTHARAHTHTHTHTHTL